jgi:hypothetical protein
VSTLIFSAPDAHPAAWAPDPPEPDAGDDGDAAPDAPAEPDGLADPDGLDGDVLPLLAEPHAEISAAAHISPAPAAHRAVTDRVIVAVSLSACQATPLAPVSDTTPPLEQWLHAAGTGCGAGTSALPPYIQ